LFPLSDRGFAYAGTTVNCISLSRIACIAFKNKAFILFLF